MSKKRSSRPSLSKTGIVERLCRFSVELPSWGFSNTGTRFGKYLQDAAAVDLEDKLADAGIVNKFTGAAPSVAVHALWDFPNGFDNDVHIILHGSWNRKLGSRLHTLLNFTGCG